MVLFVYLLLIYLELLYADYLLSFLWLLFDIFSMQCLMLIIPRLVVSLFLEVMTKQFAFFPSIVDTAGNLVLLFVIIV